MYFNFCNKYRKFKKTKISYVFKKIISLSIVYAKSSNEYEKIFKKRRINWNIKNSWFN